MFFIRVPFLYVCLIVNLLSGCGSGSSEATNDVSQIGRQAPILTSENKAIPINTDVENYAILIFGNSHVSQLNTNLNILFQHGLPEKNITNIELDQGSFLSNRLLDGRSIESLNQSPWTHVIFQAQKYSQSGQTTYTTTGSQTWIQLAKNLNITPILFPEHPRRENIAEGKTIHDIHVGIANLQSSCVAPVGLVWDRVISLRPDLVLHQEDGNHGSELGNILTAMVFFEVIANVPADLLPFIEELNIDDETKGFFGQIVSQVIAENPPCGY